MDGAVLDAYLAGIFDGEGCVSIHLNKRGFISVGVRVMMCDSEPIDALFRRFGGKRSVATRKSSTGRDVHIWHTDNGLAVGALTVFSILCLNKRRACELALSIAVDMARNPPGHGLALIERERRLGVLKEFMNLPNRRLGTARAPDPGMAAKYLAPRTYGAVRVKRDDGVIFTNQREAARLMGVSSCAISYAIRKGGRSCGHRWSFVNGH